MKRISAKARRARDTRWLYRVESHLLTFNRDAMRDLPISTLRTITAAIWAAEGGDHKTPRLIATRGMRYLGKWCSYCLRYDEIVLARHHRNLLVLLHELTHALGPCVHGPKFIRLYFRLLHQYAGYSRVFLQALAEQRGMTL